LEVTHPVAVAARVPNRLSEGLPDSRWGARVPQQCAVLGHDGQGWVRRQVTVIVAVGNRPVTNFLAFTKATLGEAVAEVRVSDRLTDSAVCLVAAEHGPDRQLEKLLAGAGRITSAAKPIPEVNPRHQLIIALAGLGDGQRAFKEDAAQLLFDEARVLDGERPADARLFSPANSSARGPMTRARPCRTRPSTPRSTPCPVAACART
jgi:hypothetical protein